MSINKNVPVTNREKYLAKIANGEIDVPVPVNKEDYFLNEIAENKDSSDSDESGETSVGGGVCLNGEWSVVDTETAYCYICAYAVTNDEIAEYLSSGANIVLHQPELPESLINPTFPPTITLEWYAQVNCYIPSNGDNNTLLYAGRIDGMEIVLIYNDENTINDSIPDGFPNGFLFAELIQKGL